MAWYQPPVRPSGYRQVPPPNPAAAFQQIPAQGVGYEQVTDSNNPAARQYALQRLHAAVASGLLPQFLPEWNADPARAWRGVSGLLAQSGAFRGQAPASDRLTPDQGLLTDEQLGANPGPPHFRDTVLSGGVPGGPRRTPAVMGQGYPGRTVAGNQGVSVRPDQLNSDWRGRIRQMAAALNPSDTLARHGLENFQALQGQPAEDAFRHIASVMSAHQAASGVARLAQATRASARRRVGMY